MFSDVATQSRRLLCVLFLRECAVSAEADGNPGRRGTTMKESIRVALCPACGACPEVILDVAKDEVCIGEEGNLVRLTKETWNTLVEKIQQGELSKL